MSVFYIFNVFSDGLYFSVIIFYYHQVVGSSSILLACMWWKRTSQSAEVYSNSVFTSPFPLFGIYSSRIPRNVTRGWKHERRHILVVSLHSWSGKGKDKSDSPGNITDKFNAQLLDSGSCTSPAFPCICLLLQWPRAEWLHVPDVQTKMFNRHVQRSLAKKNPTLLSRLSRLIGFAHRSDLLNNTRNSISFDDVGRDLIRSSVCQDPSL